MWYNYYIIRADRPSRKDIKIMNSTEMLDFLPTSFKKNASIAIAIPMVAPKDAKRVEALCMLSIKQAAADMLFTKKPQRFTMTDKKGTYSMVVGDFYRIKKDEHYRALFCKMSCLFCEVREVKFF